MIGATVDINYGMLTMDQPFELGQYSEDLKGWAVTGTLGLLVKPSETFSIGLSYKLPFTAKLSGDVTIPTRLWRSRPSRRRIPGRAKRPGRCGSAAASPSSRPTS